MSKKKILLLVLLIIIFVAALPLVDYFFLPTEKNAVRCLQGFIEGVNANEPEKVYAHLSTALRAKITKEDFVKNFEKERSYPYLTPLYLYLDKLELTEDKRAGDVTFIVAARLPGQIMKAKVVYEHGKYNVIAFENIVDGSFIKKFKKLQ